MKYASQIEILQRFGFSEIESLTYCFLLEESPATGYRISHATGKAAANTYKAIASLEQKGAVVIDDSKSRLCRATPADELIASLEEKFRKNKNAAVDALSKLKTSKTDSRIYQLRSVDQVFTRAESMIRKAKEIILIDAFPEPLDRLTPEIVKALKRGVTIGITLYDNSQHKKLSEVGISCALRPEGISDRWAGLQLSIVVDARENMQAMLGNDAKSVSQAVWSNSLFLSCLAHSGASSELFASKAANLGLADHEELAPLRALSLLNFKPSGLNEFLSDN